MELHLILTQHSFVFNAAALSSYQLPKSSFNVSKSLELYHVSVNISVLCPAKGSEMLIMQTNHSPRQSTKAGR